MKLVVEVSEPTVETVIRSVRVQAGGHHADVDRQESGLYVVLINGRNDMLAAGELEIDDAVAEAKRYVTRRALESAVGCAAREAVAAL